MGGHRTTDSQTGLPVKEALVSVPIPIGACSNGVAGLAQLLGHDAAGLCGPGIDDILALFDYLANTLVRCCPSVGPAELLIAVPAGFGPEGVADSECDKGS